MVRSFFVSESLFVPKRSISVFDRFFLFISFLAHAGEKSFFIEQVSCVL